MCPYLKYGNVCNFSDSTQSGYNHKTYCLGSGKYTSCPNYTNRTPQEKESKKV